MHSDMEAQTKQTISSPRLLLVVVFYHNNSDPKTVAMEVWKLERGDGRPDVQMYRKSLNHILPTGAYSNLTSDNLVFKARHLAIRNPAIETQAFEAASTLKTHLVATSW